MVHASATQHVRVRTLKLVKGRLTTYCKTVFVWSSRKVVRSRFARSIYGVLEMLSYPNIADTMCVYAILSMIELSDWMIASRNEKYFTPFKTLTTDIFSIYERRCNSLIGWLLLSPNTFLFSYVTCIVCNHIHSLLRLVQLAGSCWVKFESWSYMIQVWSIGASTKQ